MIDSHKNEFFIPGSDDLDPATFRGSTLILPVVSLANVPQLSVDLFINATLLGPLKKVGLLDPAYHIPVIGAIDQQSNGPLSNRSKNLITTPIEVYQTLDKQYTFVQQRSPVLKAKKDEWIMGIRNWISSAAFSSILILVSVDAATRSDPHIQHPSMFFHYIRPDSRPPTELRQRIRARYASLIPGNSDALPTFSAGGLAKRLISALQSTDLKFEVNTLIAYVAEGDNRFDAKSLAHEIISILSPNQPISLEDLIEPISWKASDSYQDRTREDLFG